MYTCTRNTYICIGRKINNKNQFITDYYLSIVHDENCIYFYSIAKKAYKFFEYFFMLLIFPKHILKKTSLYTLFSLQYKNHVIIKIFIVSITTLN